MQLQQYVPLAISSGGEDKLPAGVRSAIETLRPIVVKHGRMGTLSLLAGGFTVLKGLASLRSNKGRAVRQIAVGAGWIAIGRAQQQASDGGVEVSEPWTDDGPEEEEPGVIAEENTESSRDFGDPETGETPEAEGAGEEAEIAGPTEGDAVPETDKEGGPAGHPADDVEMVDPDPDEAEEGELLAEDSDDDDEDEE
ncbi:hypothetical protein [Halalkalicoccus jeotgali]|uniref:Uncharacterized protein n=1 Tax=Halalkalicoccus jeotgali (strain DSM 18796 / CECT 7217 / JCM 14584 / KCTC 4019 / B3) TaxID=795797 RepID=D8J8S7_HALJB|nr:hypothetical protein [Halalkalicoccus jeotgali]ADJ14262.1 hypothetical protein HacjB3_04355 [Halalkalicoccus jeotgali B3]ELY40524.1 hypothetical protein C497_02717 [Halalkalicoccus jeotgali B3]